MKDRKFLLRPTNSEVEEAIRILILHMGDDPERSELIATPRRVREALKELSKPHEFEMTTFESHGYNDLVIVRDIPLYSLCEHHFMVWEGSCTIGYIPALNWNKAALVGNTFVGREGRILGLSKLARTVARMQAGLTTQERVTHDIAEEIANAISPEGVAVVTVASHSCMTARGVRAHGTSTVASCMLGSFRDQAPLRQEFLALAGFNGKGGS